MNKISFKDEKELQDIIECLAISDQLSSVGIFKVDVKKFQTTTIFEDRVVGFKGAGKELEIFCIGQSKMKKTGMSYKNLLDNYPDLHWKHQKIGKELEITPEDNVNLIEKYEDFNVRKKTILIKNDKKTIRSYKRV